MPAVVLNWPSLERELDDLARKEFGGRDRVVSVETCVLCKQGPGEACREINGTRFLSWTHAQPGGDS